MTCIILINTSGKPGSWNPDIGNIGGGGIIMDALRNKIMKIFCNDIKDVKYNNPIVKPDFTSL